MKILSQPSRREFSLVRLYLEDYYSIVEVLKEQCDSMKIVADRFLIEEPKEIETLNQQVVKNLEIETPKPFIRITLSPRSSEVWVSEDDANAIGLFSKLTEILAETQSPWRFVEQGVPVLVISVIYVAALFVSFYILEKYQLVTWLAGPILMAVAWLASAVLKERKSLLFLERKSAKQSFLRRRKDEVILAVISATVGALLTILGTWLLGGFR